MNEIDLRFSSLGLLTYQFEMKFKKVLQFLETMDDPELLFCITRFLDTEDLLALLGTCKKLNMLKVSPVIEVRILKQKIKFLQSPKQQFTSLNLLPAYYEFLLHQKQEEKEVPKNAKAFFKNLKELKKTQEAFNKRKELAIKAKSTEVTKLLSEERAYNGFVSKLEREIEEEAKLYKSVELSKEPQRKSEQPKSYVEKFREEYGKIKEFERKQNIRQLEILHKKESEKIRVKGEIETPFKNIPIIEIKHDDKLSVVRADLGYATKASRFLHRVKAIFGLNVYY